MKIGDKIALWWNGYCLKHLCPKEMTEPSVGMMCPKCVKESVLLKQELIHARITRIQSEDHFKRSE